MMKVTVQTFGLDTMKQHVMRVRGFTNNPDVTKKFVEKIALRVKQEINLHWKYHALKHEGRNLSSSIFSVLQSKNVGIVSSGNPCASFVFEGTKPHMISKTGRPILITTMTRSGIKRFWMKKHHGSKPRNYLVWGLHDFERLDYDKLINETLKKIK